VVVVADVGDVVVVGKVVGVVFEEKRSVPAQRTSTATMPTMMPRRMFWRRFA
jgi:pyruvate/2-oxoglutarate dehydrogenase complex dihydrolipoamide acyltransferase (E2) component